MTIIEYLLYYNPKIYLIIRGITKRNSKYGLIFANRGNICIAFNSVNMPYFVIS